MSATKQKCFCVLLSAGLLVAPGCSAFQPKMQTLTVMPSDPSADVYINGNLVGRGTITKELERGKTYSVMARIGDRVGTAHVDRKISGTGIADIIGGCLILVPFIGCLTPGFWDLDPNTVSIALPPAVPYGSTYQAPPTYQPPPSYQTRPQQQQQPGQPTAPAPRTTTTTTR